MSMYLYVTGTTLVLHFICTGTVATVATLVTATLFLCTNVFLVLHWYCFLYVLVLWILLVHWSSHYISLYQYVTGTGLYMYCYCGYCWYIGISHSLSLYQYVTGTSLVLMFICTGTVVTVGSLVPVTLCLCAYMLLVPHWYCSSYVLVLWVLSVNWYMPLYFLVPICYWYCTGTGLYMYWYCGYCWYIGTSHSMSLCLYVTGTTLELLFICTGNVGTVGTQVPATLFLCTNMLLALHLYCSLYVLVLWVLFVHWWQFLCCSEAYLLLVPHSYCSLYVPVLWELLVQWYQPLYFSVTICYSYLHWYYYFICTGTVATVGTLVVVTLCLCAYKLLVPHWYCSLYVLLLWVQLVHWYQPLYVSVKICCWLFIGTALYIYWYCGYCWYIGTSHIYVSVPIWYW